MIDRKHITLERLIIKVQMTQDTMELFSIPVPVLQQEFSFEDHILVRILDNPLEDSLRNYVAWGKL